MNSVSSTLGNTVILFATRKCQSLHSPSKALLCSLALTDLVVGLVVIPLFIAHYLTIILEIPSYYCAISMTFGRISTFIGAASLATITTIAIDRFLAFHLRLRYREIVKFKRVDLALVVAWILSGLWSGSWFWSTPLNIIWGAIALFGFCLITSLCYLNIHRGLRRHIAQIHQQENANELGDLNFPQYKKTVHNMLWIYGLLFVCYVPYLSSLFAILISGLNNFTRFAMYFSAIAIHFNSSLNPVLYCWRIKELKEKVLANLSALCNFILAH